MTHRHRQARAGGFTLIELIVAIGAVALIAVGIAAVFESIGRTVSGGRRVNQLNQFAALIERQMRADFEAMTRDGVLVLRHDFADANGDGVIDLGDNSPDAVLNAPTQTADEARVRRIDQILFFARGDFTSARWPLIPGVNASANEAKIWYGHGMRLDPIEDYRGRDIGGSGNPLFERPQVNDGAPSRPFLDERALGFSEPGYTTNPNRYAADWALLRQVTILAQPNSADLNLTTDPGYWSDLGFRTNGRAAALDSEIQLGGQPAASHAFSHLASVLPVSLPRAYARREVNADQPRRPFPGSGIVDAATTDLAEIRRVIMDVGVFPWVAASNPDIFDPQSGNFVFDDAYNASLNLNDLNNNLLHMHAWMQDLLPVMHDQRSPVSSPPGVRARFEDQLPDYVATLRTYSDDATSRYPFIQNFRLTDQRVLGSSVFVPRCTEFIVEYSFGRTVEDINSPFFGQLVWHGLQREVEIGGEAFDAVRPYPYDTTTGEVTSYQMSYTRRDGSRGTRELSPALLYGLDAGNPLFDATSLTAHFGYNDPTFTPADDNDPATVPWPWPTLIRVTLTLADPVDPAIEQTFQFVFETPEARAF
jgi:type II secretory pathway pseudopilin PulG